MQGKDALAKEGFLESTASACGEGDCRTAVLAMVRCEGPPSGAFGAVAKKSLVGEVRRWWWWW